jgi:hypothetical protein
MVSIERVFGRLFDDDVEELYFGGMIWKFQYNLIHRIYDHRESIQNVILRPKKSVDYHSTTSNPIL